MAGHLHAVGRGSKCFNIVMVSARSKESGLARFRARPLVRFASVVVHTLMCVDDYRDKVTFLVAVPRALEFTVTDVGAVLTRNTNS